MGIIKNWQLFSNAISVFRNTLVSNRLAFIIVIEIKGGRYVFYHGNYGWQERF